MLSGAAVVRLLTLIRLSTALLRTPVLPGAHRLGSPRMQGNLFKLVEDMPGGKAVALIESYKLRIENIRSK
jgi:hypothetical protein